MVHEKRRINRNEEVDETKCTPKWRFIETNRHHPYRPSIYSCGELKLCTCQVHWRGGALSHSLSPWFLISKYIVKFQGSFIRVSPENCCLYTNFGSHGDLCQCTARLLDGDCFTDRACCLSTMHDHVCYLACSLSCYQRPAECFGGVPMNAPASIYNYKARSTVQNREVPN